MAERKTASRPDGAVKLTAGAMHFGIASPLSAPPAAYLLGVRPKSTSSSYWSISGKRSDNFKNAIAGDTKTLEFANRVIDRAFRGQFPPD